MIKVIGVGVQLVGISSVHGQLHDGLCLVNIGLDCHNDYVAVFFPFHYHLLAIMPLHPK